MTISDEAVEAAAIVHCNRGESYWPDWTDEAKAEAMQDMRAALEAAAPHIAESSNDVQWGVRDKASLRIAGHPSEESARLTAAAHPNWYEVVSRPRPKPEPRWEVSS